MRTGRNHPRCTHREIDGVWHKPCTGCNQVLPLDAFPKNRSRWDGLHSYCRACNRAKQTKDRRQPWHKEMRRRYRNTESGRRAYERYRKVHPGKAYAQGAVQSAVESGKLVRPEACEACGRGGIIDAHHDDYAEVYEVRWLCRWCHQAWHRINGEGANADTQHPNAGIRTERAERKRARIPLVAAMYAAGKSRKDLAEHFGVSTATIADDLKQAQRA